MKITRMHRDEFFAIESPSSLGDGEPIADLGYLFYIENSPVIG